MFARSDDPDLRNAGRDELKRRLAPIPYKDLDPKRLSDHWTELISILAETSLADDLDWLLQEFDKSPAYYALPWLKAIVRLEGKNGKERLIKLLPDPKRSAIAIWLCGDLFAGSGDDELVNALSRIIDQKNTSSICNALLKIDGERATGLVRSLNKTMGETDGAEFQRELDPTPYDEIEKSISITGIIDEKTLADAVQKLKSRVEDKSLQFMPSLTDVFHAAGIAFLSIRSRIVSPVATIC